jgi:hypothetical protein
MPVNLRNALLDDIKQNDNQRKRDNKSKKYNDAFKD